MIPVAIVTLRFLEVGSKQLAVGSNALSHSCAYLTAINLLSITLISVDIFEERIVSSEHVGS